jgi:hypothetical protein
MRAATWGWSSRSPGWVAIERTLLAPATWPPTTGASALGPIFRYTKSTVFALGLSASF